MEWPAANEFLGVEAAKKARKAGLKVIMDRCILKDQRGAIP